MLNNDYRILEGSRGPVLARVREGPLGLPFVLRDREAQAQDYLGLLDLPFFHTGGVQHPDALAIKHDAWQVQTGRAHLLNLHLHRCLKVSGRPQRGQHELRDVTGSYRRFHCRFLKI